MNAKLEPLNYYRNILAERINAEDDNNKIIFDALAFAYHHHSDLYRKSGEPYIDHPLSVAGIIVKDFNLRDPELISSALLHDVVEDTDVTLSKISELFGRDVSLIVDGCTKVSHQKLDRPDIEDKTHAKILHSASKRIEVLIIKLADRIHNMRTIEFLPESVRIRKAKETIEVYVPESPGYWLSCFIKSLSRET